MNPLMDSRSLPPFGEITPDHIKPALEAAITRHEATVATVVAVCPATFADTWLPLERAGIDLSAIWSTVSHLHGVAETAELHAAFIDGQKRLVENEMKVAQDRRLYASLTALSQSPEFRALSDADQVAISRAIRSFELSGVALDEGPRERFRDISVELSTLASEFGSALLDATDAWSELITDDIHLAGLSNADLAMFASAAAEKGEEGWLITLRQPSINAILTFSQNRELRARVYRASTTRASDQGPHAGRFDNSSRILQILELRREAAALLGFDDPVAWSLSTKMAPNAAVIIDFLNNLATRAKPIAEREMAELREFAHDTLGIDDFQAWDAAFAANRVRQLRYDIDEQQVRSHFPVMRVIEGWQTLLGQLFGIRLVERTDASLYHPDARFFDVMDEAGTVIAGLYLDLYARAGKRGGAWMDEARPRVCDGGMVTAPVAYLVCNFTPENPNMPSLLSHQDIITLLHETGHCLHLLFTQVDRPSIAGTNGFEWDAVELPSQLMEDFAWDRDVLTGMSGHFVTGKPLPAAMFDRLLGGRRFLAGMAIVRQVELALFDLQVHLAPQGSDPMAILRAVRDEVSVMSPPEWNRLPHSFSHIFAGAYACGYYSYLWAELLAADAFMAFVEAGLVDRATADRFRHEVLARGATRPAVESFRAFRGRDPEPAAMLARHGIQ